MHAATETSPAAPALSAPLAPLPKALDIAAEQPGPLVRARSRVFNVLFLGYTFLFVLAVYPLLLARTRRPLARAMDQLRQHDILGRVEIGQQMMELVESEGIRPPRLYDLGFNHNNCGGACIKAGQAQWALLWRMFPERYLEKEKWEEEMRASVGDHSILRDRSNGTTKPLTLRAFRAKLEAQQSFDANDWGGCGCALPT